jgi:hypothetical protein
LVLFLLAVAGVDLAVVVAVVRLGVGFVIVAGLEDG